MSIITTLITKNLSNTLTSFSDRLEKELRNIIINTRKDDTTYKGIMYHYTSASTIPKILQSKDNTLCLRFTDYRFLNDKSEGEEIKEHFQKVLQEMLIQKKNNS